MSETLQCQSCADARRLLRLVWNHMHGQNMDGSRRPWPSNDECAANWNKLSDAIGKYLEPLSTEATPGERIPQTLYEDPN